MALPRLAVRNIRPLDKGIYQFTLRLYWGDGTVAFDSLKWRLKPDGALMPPAAKVFGKWIEQGDIHKNTEQLVSAAVQRVITKVHEIFSKSESLDHESRFIIWATKEEHVADLI